MSIAFCWLGVAGVTLKAGNQMLAIDPFFTRPGLRGFFTPVTSNAPLVAKKLRKCDHVLVTHAHWDHVMDVPAVQRTTGAACYGSANTCQVLKLHGIGADHIHHVRVGDRLALGAFKVEVVAGQHSRIPLQRVFNGALIPGLQPPLRLQDYRMDECLGYRISVMGRHVLICAADPQPADILFAVAQETSRYYQRLFKGTLPGVFIPIHWDNFLRPLDEPLRRFTRPGRMALWRVTMLARQVVKGVRVIIPEIFREYTV
jgi:L-ascorbate metabolism protein UlaG (beta-lactamase superfamily)